MNAVGTGKRGCRIALLHLAVDCEHRIQQVDRFAAVTFRETLIEFRAKLKRAENSAQILRFDFCTFLVRSGRKKNYFLYVCLPQTAHDFLHGFFISAKRIPAAFQNLLRNLDIPVGVAVDIVHAEEDEHLVGFVVEQVEIHTEQRIRGASPRISAVERFEVNSRKTGEIIIADEADIVFRMSEAVAEKRDAVSGLKRVHHNSFLFPLKKFVPYNNPHLPKSQISRTNKTKEMNFSS